MVLNVKGKEDVALKRCHYFGDSGVTISALPISLLVRRFLRQGAPGREPDTCRRDIRHVQQFMWTSPTNVVEYTADSLDDKSGFLWVIAGSPNCTPRLFDRFLLLPYTHRFLAANPAAPPQVPEALSHSTNSVVRETVARNRKSPEPVLQQLAADTDLRVRDSAMLTLKQNGR